MAPSKAPAATWSKTDGHHRSPLGTGRSRGHPQAPRHDQQRRFRRAFHLRQEHQRIHQARYRGTFTLAA